MLAPDVAVIRVRPQRVRPTREAYREFHRLPPQIPPKIPPRGSRPITSSYLFDIPDLEIGAAARGHRNCMVRPGNRGRYTEY